MRVRGLWRLVHAAGGTWRQPLAPEAQVGNVAVNVAPSPGRLSTSRRPP